MPNYQKSKIYCIRSYLLPDQVYVGATTQPLSSRLSKHRHDFLRWQSGRTNFRTSFALIACGDAYIELIKNFPCNNKEELAAEEGRYIREMDCVNKQKNLLNWQNPPCPHPIDPAFVLSTI
jgi:hypothetical protein